MPKYNIKHKPTGQTQDITAADAEAALSIVCSEQDWMSPEMKKYAGWWSRKDCEITEITEETA
jgi:hypothetical protein